MNLKLSLLPSNIAAGPMQIQKQSCAWMHLQKWDAILDIAILDTAILDVAILDL